MSFRPSRFLVARELSPEVAQTFIWIKTIGANGGASDIALAGVPHKIRAEGARAAVFVPFKDRDRARKLLRSV